MGNQATVARPPLRHPVVYAQRSPEGGRFDVIDGSDTMKERRKMHQPINASFDEVLGAIWHSKYRDKKTLKKNL
jgi:hypothetical protein